jgi:hypothetical protein
MSTFEFAEQLNQPGHRFSNTVAMTAEAAELAFVRRALGHGSTCSLCSER